MMPTLRIEKSGPDLYPVTVRDADKLLWSLYNAMEPCRLLFGNKLVGGVECGLYGYSVWRQGNLMEMVK